MGLLQDPIKAIEQAEWYLDNHELEKFPGAFELAAGNICRQTLEQILFILCFFSGIPKERYFRTDRRILRTAGEMLKELGKIDPATNKRYWEVARQKGPRVRKFARYPLSLKAWLQQLNEPSHFSAKFRNVDHIKLKNFIKLAKQLFDKKDKYLIIAIVNQLLSDGKIQATLGHDQDNTPGVMTKAVVSPWNLERTKDGSIALNGPEKAFKVISATEIPRGPWPKNLVLVQHSVGISIGMQLVSKSGEPINLQTMETLLISFSKTKGQRAALTRRLRRLGFDIKWGAK